MDINTAAEKKRNI